MVKDRKTDLIRFNVQNIKYAVMKEDGTYDKFKPYGSTARTMALEVDQSTKKIYGDGKVIAVLGNERGKTGTMTTNNVSNQYEIDMGRKVETKSGIADVKPTRMVKHAIYFETSALKEDGGMPLAKTVLYGVTSTHPSESFAQNEDDINESTFDTELTITGTYLMDSDGEAKAKDKNGNEIVAWQLTSTPEDEGFETFCADDVAMPVLPASEAV